MIRVTVGSSVAASLYGLQTNASRLAAMQAQMSSGNQITKPSDDPAGTVRALQLRADVAQSRQHRLQIDMAQGAVQPIAREPHHDQREQYRKGCAQAADQSAASCGHRVPAGSRKRHHSGRMTRIKGCEERRRPRDSVQ